MTLQPDQLVRLFGRNVRRRRLELGITQEELAKRLNSVFSYISALERGKKTPWLKNLAPIAAALEMEPDALLQPDEELALELKQGKAIERSKRKKVAAGS